LPAVLQKRESVIDLLIDGRGGDDSDDAAHVERVSFGWVSMPIGFASILSHRADDEVDRIAQ
jgi:hypothetical protein